ncbi:MAG: hypothetical protein RMI45_01740 [Ignisphaera sp.]|nr:hypothetical protein [Ignisphaera sp.]MDW8084951.1 hypothetical protein [Ignisphaera sp.]
MDLCPRCSSSKVDVYKFQLPSELPVPLLMMISKGVRNEIERLLRRYSAIELSICMNCGYTEMKFNARS